MFSDEERETIAKFLDLVSKILRKNHPGVDCGLDLGSIEYLRDDLRGLDAEPDYPHEPFNPIANLYMEVGYAALRKGTPAAKLIEEGI